MLDTIHPSKATPCLRKSLIPLLNEARVQEWSSTTSSTLCGHSTRQSTFWYISSLFLPTLLNYTFNIAKIDLSWYPAWRSSFNAAIVQEFKFVQCLMPGASLVAVETAEPSYHDQSLIAYKTSFAFPNASSANPQISRTRKLSDCLIALAGLFAPFNSMRMRHSQTSFFPCSTSLNLIALIDFDYLFFYLA